jgi:hypothetical protein
MSDSIYKAPSSGDSGLHSLEALGAGLAIQSPGKLPSLCVECGTTSDLVTRSKKIYYANPLIYLWIILSPLILIIVYYCCRKILDIEYERCKSCDSKKRMWSKIALVAWLSFFAFIFLSIAADGVLGAIFGWMILASFFFALVTMVLRSDSVGVSGTSKPYFYLKRVKPAVWDGLRASANKP